MISALKTAVLKRKMILEFISCISVTFIQKTYENNSAYEITQSEADPGFFVGGGALLRNGVIDW